MSDGLPRELEDLVEFFPHLSNDIVCGVLASVGPDHAFENLLAFSDDVPARGGVAHANSSQFLQEMFRKEVLNALPVAAPAAPSGVHPAGVETFFMCSAAGPPRSKGGRPRLEGQGAALVAAYSNSSAAELQGVGWDGPNVGVSAPRAPHAFSDPSGIHVATLSGQTSLFPAEDTCIAGFEPWDVAPQQMKSDIGVRITADESVLAPSPDCSVAWFPGLPRPRPAYSPPPVHTSTIAAPPIMPTPIPMPHNESEGLADRVGPLAELWGSSDLPTNTTPPLPPALPPPESPMATPGSSLRHLFAMFPEKLATVVERVLWDCGGSVEEALEALISMSSDGTRSGSPAISISGSESVDEARSYALHPLPSPAA